MVWCPCSSSLTVEEILNDVDTCLEKASNENDTKSRLKLCRNAKAMMKDAGKQLKSEGNNFYSRAHVAKAYHKHSLLLEGLNEQSKALKSQRLAEEWGYKPASCLGSATPTTLTTPRRPVESEPTHSSLTESTTDTILPSPRPTIGSEKKHSSDPGLKARATQLYLQPPTVMIVSAYDITTSERASLNDEALLPSEPFETDTPLDSEKHPWGTRENVEPFSQTPEIPPAQKLIFASVTTPSVAKHQLPGLGEHIKDTAQLAYCLNLMDAPSYGVKLDQVEQDWLSSINEAPREKERLQTLASNLVRTFIRDEIKGPDAVKEIVCLAPSLAHEDFRRLLHTFVDGINNTLLQDNYLLDGLAQLIRNSSPKHLDVNDLVKILKLLSEMLQETHSESIHRYQSALTTSRVLDIMMDTKVKNIRREELRAPLLGLLRGLRKSRDPYLAFQGAYAYQALLYIPDDESTTQEVLRRTGMVVQGISGIVSAVKAIDLNRFVDGLENIQKGLSGAVPAFEVIIGTVKNSLRLVEGGQDFIECIKEGFSSERKSVWYPALRGLDIFIQEGRFTVFERLIRGAPCQKHPLFQWGVCQRLGEIANNPLWDINIRKCAVKFLLEIYEDDTTWNSQAPVKQWILCILNQLEKSSDKILAGHVEKLHQQSKSIGIPNKPALGQASSSVEIFTKPYPLVQALQPNIFPLLSCVQTKPKKLDVEAALCKLRDERLQDQGDDIYVSPKATATVQGTESFDLMSKAQEFLRSEKTVFLLRGSSGSGKSTFNRALEIRLWGAYKAGGDIPLFIDLPAIDIPEEDLIVKQLHKANFTDNLIKELKEHRRFVLICDGYDESQLTQNLYTRNRLNQKGEWRAKVVITCRTEYMSHDYKGLFQPTGRNNTRDSRLFEETVIAPFDDNQIREYIEQYALKANPPLDPTTLMATLKKISDLQDLVKNPFILKNSLEVLPQIEEASKMHSTTRFTRVELYDNFVLQWVERNQTRIQEMKLGSTDRGTFTKLLHSGFAKRGFRFLADLAAAIYIEHEGNHVVHYSPLSNENDWKDQLFSNSDGKNFLREAIPLTCTGDYYHFIHASYLEYGLSLAVFDPKVYEKYAEPPSTPPHSGGRKRAQRNRNSTNSTLAEKSVTANHKQLVDSPLGKIVLTGNQTTMDCLEFLVQRVQQYPMFKAQLLEVIGRSKFDTSVNFSIAAANAITILVKAGVSFNGADLRNIRIPKADLSYGVFDSALLDGADLREVNFRNIWLRGSSLSNAKMEDAKFGELPFIKAVRHCAFSPDGNKFAVILKSGDINLYDMSSWERIEISNRRSDQFSNITFPPTSSQIAFGGDKTVWVYDVTGSNPRNLEGHEDTISCVVYSPRGDQIASGSYDTTVRLWDAYTGESIHNLSGHSESITAVVYSPNGDRIVSASEDYTVRLWDVESGTCVHSFTDNTKYVITGVIYSPNGDQVASVDSVLKVQLWNVDTGKCIHTFENGISTEPLEKTSNSIAYSLRGDHIACASDDSTVKIWDANTGECHRILHGHNGRVTSVMYSPSEAEDLIASGGVDKTVRLWDVETDKCIHTFRGHSQGVARIVFSPEGDRISSESFGEFRLWNIENDFSIHMTNSHADEVHAIAYSPKGDKIASGSKDATVRIWDALTGGYIHAYCEHTDSIVGVAYSPDGSLIASASCDNTVRFWNPDTLECAYTIEDQLNRFTCISYSPDGKYIVAGSAQKTLRLWDFKAGECIRTFKGHDGAVTSVAYSPKGIMIVSGSEDKTVRLWGVQNGKCISTFDGIEARGGHKDVVTTVAFSPKGNLVASGSKDKTARLWEAKTGKLLYTFRGHDDCVTSAVFSPDGKWVIIGSDDGSFSVRDVATGDRKVTTSSWNGKIQCLALKGAKDGLSLVTGGEDGSVRQWCITEKEGKPKATLDWSSLHEVLNVSDASFANASDITVLDRMLMEQ
ncbi:hypothetical protein BGX26_011119, partial [Mortierella sp. AD094]